MSKRSILCYSFPAHFGHPALLCYRNLPYVLRIWRAHIGVNFLCFLNSQSCLYDTHSNSDWLFTTRSSVLEADWLLFADFNYLTKPKRSFEGTRSLTMTLLIQSCVSLVFDIPSTHCPQRPSHTLTETAK